MKLNTKANNPFIALSYLIKGLNLISHPQLRHFVLLPIMINFLLYSVALVLGYFYLSDLIHQFIPHWLLWLAWLLYPAFFLGFFVIGFFSFSVLANIIAAPFYDKLAAKTLSVVYPNAITNNTEHFIITVMASEFKRLRYLLTRLIPLAICLIIPVINIIAPLLWALFGAWVMALEYMAYPLENSGILFEEQKQTLKPIRLGVLSFGGLVMLGLSIPVLNILIAPAAVIGSTLYLHDYSQE